MYRRSALACLLVLGPGSVTAGASVAPPALPAAAPGPVEVAAHPEPLVLLADEDAALAANKRLVFDMWRSIVNAGHVELADTMLREDYIQHSPVLSTGRAAFKQIFSAVPRVAIPELVSPPVVTIIAEGDLVVMALREEWPEPAGAGKYTTTHFNLFRVEGGQLAEHWHSVQEAPGPQVLPAEQGGPQPVRGKSGAAQLELLRAATPALVANKRLVFDAWREAIDGEGKVVAGRDLGEGYIEHDPTADIRRRAAEAPGADRPVEPSLAVPLVAVVAQGDLVVMVTAGEHLHPSRAGATYTTTGFDMFRIVDGRIVEHWNGAMKPGTPLPRYGQ